MQRFKNEVRAAAALDHPNIVSVYSVGDENGVYFYAMQLIRGQNLSAVIQTLSNHHSSHTASHFSGIYLLRAGLIGSAINRFDLSLKQGPEFQAYDWLYLALAHLDSGNAEESRANYAKALTYINQQKPQDAELTRLFEAVTAKIDPDLN